MDITEAIMNRRSIRTFKKQDLHPSIIEKLLDAARWAPSAGNMQPWAFVVAAKWETKQRLSDSAYGQKSLVEASVDIVVCANLKYAAENYGARGETLYCYQDTPAATQNILLTAHSIGLGTCWIGAFNEEDVRRSSIVPLTCGRSH
ncbi:MAG: nitroreductase family protein [Candidatus Bathyarchaeia archaeon]